MRFQGSSGAAVFTCRPAATTALAQACQNQRSAGSGSSMNPCNTRIAWQAVSNFTALHLLTACHAMRMLQGFIDEPLPALRWFWQAWASAVVAAGLQVKTAAPLLPWNRIVPVALASDDEHLIKLVDSCRAEARVYGGADWRRAASRAVAQQSTG